MAKRRKKYIYKEREGREKDNKKRLTEIKI
jgi:hypothetical protein